MRTISLVILIGCLVVSIGLPLVFLFRHPGKKMDEKPFRSWIITTSLAVVVGLGALIAYGLAA